ncbi:hypothetical protein [Pseudalkalibacillus caeni]|uniref:hypothetical protein n=1 Tax=Exobacillus caeni TaxID=2574798 RepID=UPI0010FF343A|nr:hypothetical protein [Pseudalkalibacillus caeni]
MKMTDTGLMAEHLVIHDGVMHRLMDNKLHVQDEKLREIISKQIDILKDHAVTMSKMLGAEESINFDDKNTNTDKHASTVYRDRHIALDGMFTANALAKENYSHSTVMKNKGVKETHVRMAMDQLEIAKEYEKIIKENKWTVQPSSSSEERSQIVKNFKELIG